MRSKEEIYEQYIGNGQYGIDFEKKHILEAMDEYASEVLREGIEGFLKYNEYDRFTPKSRINEYLKLNK